MGEKKYAQIIVNNKSHRTDREYTYKIPRGLIDKICIGSRVIIPFGQGNRSLEGFVVDILEEIDFNPSKLKSIKRVVEHLTILPYELVDLCRWMKEQYMCKFIDALQCVMPPGTNLKLQYTIRLADDFDKNKYDEYEKLPLKQKLIIKALEKNKAVSEEFLKSYLEIENVKSHIKKLKEKNILNIEENFKPEVNVIFEKMIQVPNKKELESYMELLNKRATKQKQVLEYLLDYEEVSWSSIRNHIDVTWSTVETLEIKGLVNVYMKEKRREPYITENIIPTIAPKLTEEQQEVIKKITPTMNGKGSMTFLIHGVTGSGKTEVYMNLIEHAIRQKKEAIVLVPEISLTTQMIDRFKGRFGDVVAILHSKLSLGERHDEWLRIRRGEVKVAVGARSAVFAPFDHLGIIIIDEEHETSYKSEYSPKYHAIEVAEYRCKINNAALVLGSATPSIESYTKSLEGKIQKLEMLRRYNDNALPKVQVIDMRDELKNGNKNVFSLSLYKSVSDNLNKGKQTILFLNRRGHSTFVSCRSCGYVMKCPYCDISLTYHSNLQNLSCHYCGFNRQARSLCPSCGSKYIKYFGVGTEKLEMLTKETFPSARIARLDLDTTTRKGSMDKIIRNFRDGNIDILIGTQMIAKGLDFPNVTLVGVIAADTSLNLPDFRAAEKTFQLITQVSGRAGRGQDLGKVIVQTYEPEHYAITTSQNHDYQSFYNQEISLRREFLFPPFTHLFNIIFIGSNERMVNKAAKYFAKTVHQKLIQEKIKPEDALLGPNPAPLYKVKQKYRWQIIIKSKDVDLNKIRGIINYMRTEEMNNDNFKNIVVSLDINSYNMF